MSHPAARADSRNMKAPRGEERLALIFPCLHSSPELMEVDTNSKAASDSEEDSETETSRVRPKKSKISEDDIVKADLVDRLKNSVKLDKVKLPKFKDYEWIRL